MRTAHPHTDGRVDRDGIGLHYEIYGDGPETIRFIPTWMFIPSRGYSAYGDHDQFQTHLADFMAA